MRSDASGAPRAVLQAMFSAAQRGRSWIIGKSPVDRGILKNAWRVLKMGSEGVELVNDQPYAGVMERGARPFIISKAGIEALAAWVKRKILDTGMGLITGSKSSRKAAISWAARKQRTENKQRNADMKSRSGWSPQGKRRATAGPKADTNLKRLKAGVQNQVSDLDKQATGIAYAIAAKFKKVGIAGRFFVRDNLEIMAGLMESEVDRFLSKFFNRAPGA